MKKNYCFWDMIELTEGEEMTPFTLIQESDDFNELFLQYKKYMETGGVYCISDKEGKLIIDGSKFIYERDGEKIYRRRFGCYSERELI